MATNSLALSKVAHELSWVRPPLQQRSQQTMERLLLSAETLINDVGFEKATVSGIVKGAKSSVGAFYTRFEDKDALLRCLLARFVSEVMATIEHVVSPELWRDTSIREFMIRLFQFSMGELEKRRKLLLAIAQLTSEEPELAEFREKITECCARGILGLIASKGAVITCADPVRALQVVTWMSMSVAESSAAVGSPYSSEEKRTQPASDLSDMVLAYLAISETGRERKSA